MLNHLSLFRFSQMILVAVFMLVGTARAEPDRPSSDVPRGAWSEIKLNWGYRGALAVDPKTGTLFGTCWRGVGLQVSRDFGKTFTRTADGAVTGNPFSPHAIFAAADGHRIAVFSSQANARSGHSLDGGKTWTPWTKAGSHGFCYGAVDWASGAILVMPHEESLAYFSTDMGKTWTTLKTLKYPGGSNKPHQVGKFGYFQSGIGVFSAKELVYSHDPGTGIQRSEDGGKTWARVGDYFCEGPVQMYKGVGYWLAKKEEDGRWSGILLSTRDKGKTWQPVGKPVDNGRSTYMPVPRIGKSEKHILVPAAAGIMETTDGGNTWTLAVKYPETVAGQLNAPLVDTFDCFAYDPVRDAFYMLFWYDPWDGKKHPQQQCWGYSR